MYKQRVEKKTYWLKVKFFVITQIGNGLEEVQ